VLLSGFQRDLLFVIAGLAETDPSGSDIKSVLDRDYVRDASHGTLYRGLGHLHEEGYLRKHPIDGRTDSYHLTDEAEAGIRSYLQWATTRLARDEDALAICLAGGDRR